jgi:hypothetical protein
MAKAKEPDTAAVEEQRQEDPIADAAAIAGLVFMILSASVAAVIIVIARWGLGLQQPGVVGLAILIGLGVGLGSAMLILASGGPKPSRW